MAGFREGGVEECVHDNETGSTYTLDEAREHYLGGAYRETAELEQFLAGDLVPQDYRSLRRS